MINLNAHKIHIQNTHLKFEEKQNKNQNQKKERNKKEKTKNLNANTFRFLQPKFGIPDVTSEVESLNVGWVFKHDLQNNK
jgi:hypothetical protein